jgi:sec-independent protein translocase protein TatA
MAPGIWQILIIALIILVLFGGRRIPLIMEDLAKGIKGFKKGLKDDEEQAPPPLEKKATEEKSE